MAEAGAGWSDLTWLTAGHAAELESFAITPEVAARSDVYSAVTSRDLPEGVPDYWAKKLPAKVYFWRYNGHEEPQLAPDDRSGNAAKYLFADKSQTFMNETLELDDGGPVMIVEGTKQQLAAASHAPDGWSVYGVAGCWNWNSTDLSVFGDREIVVIFDGDIARNKDVYDAASKLGSILGLYGASAVKFAVLPVTGNDGLDDLLGRAAPGSRAGILANILAGAKDLPKAPAQGAGAGNPYVNAQGSLLSKKLAQEIIDQRPCALTRDDRVAIYENGVYTRSEPAFSSVVSDLLGDHFRASHESTARLHVKGLLHAADLRIRDWSGGPLLNVANGMLHLPSGDLKEHDPSYLSEMQFPVEWDPHATCPRYEEWIQKMLPDQWEDLEEVASTMLDPSSTPRKTLFAYGPSRSGKSTFIHLLQHIAGSQATSAQTLQELCGRRFSPAELAGKALNCAADLSSEHVSDLNKFKAITGGDLVSAENKGGQLFQFTNRALLAFSANEIPTIGETSRAYFERTKPFHFSRSFAGAEDPSIEAAMLEELPGILVRLVAAWQRMQDRPGLYQETDPLVEYQFEVASDRVRQWVAETMAVTVEVDGKPITPSMAVPEGYGTTHTNLHQQFMVWTTKHGGANMGNKVFSEKLDSITGVVEVRCGGTRMANVVRTSEVASGATLLKVPLTRGSTLARGTSNGRYGNLSQKVPIGVKLEGEEAEKGGFSNPIGRNEGNLPDLPEVIESLNARSNPLVSKVRFRVE